MKAKKKAMISQPMAGRTDAEIEKKLCVLEDFGLSTQEDEDAVSHLAKRIEIIDKCIKDLKKVNRERMAQLCDSGGSGEERTVDDDQ